MICNPVAYRLRTMIRWETKHYVWWNRWSNEYCAGLRRIEQSVVEPWFLGQDIFRCIFLSRVKNGYRCFVRFPDRILRNGLSWASILSWRISDSSYFFPGGVLPETLGGGVLPASQNPCPIYDQSLRYSLHYLWPDQRFETLFMTRPLHQIPVSNLHYN